MKRQRSEVRDKVSENKNRRNSYIIIIVFVCILSSVLCSLTAFGSEKWSGVDEAVVEKYAKEHGREAHEPLINTGQGDLLLFVFLLAGAIGGFAAGYYWRMLIVEKAPATTKEKNITG